MNEFGAKFDGRRAVRSENGVDSAAEAVLSFQESHGNACPGENIRGMQPCYPASDNEDRFHRVRYICAIGAGIQGRKPTGGRGWHKLSLAADMRKIGMELDRARSDVENLISEVQSHEGELQEEGVAVEETIAELNRELANLKALSARAQRAKRAHALRCSRIAQTDGEYFQVMCKLMEGLAQDCPDHPWVRQWVEIRQLWEEQLLTKN